jgi:hypothetical protein
VRRCAHLTLHAGKQVSGGHSGGETPLPIPNREVKPASADGTRRATSRESRTPPVYLYGAATGGLVCLTQRCDTARPQRRLEALREAVDPPNPRVRPVNRDQVQTGLAGASARGLLGKEDDRAGAGGPPERDRRRTCGPLFAEIKNAIGTSHSADHCARKVDPSGDSAAQAQCPTRPAAFAVGVGPVAATPSARGESPLSTRKIPWLSGLFSWQRRISPRASRPTV